MVRKGQLRTTCARAGCSLSHSVLHYHAFGDYCEREGHGEFVRWQRQARGTLKQIVVPVKDDATGQIKVPEPETIGEYVMVMATGDTEARPKGGTEEYRTAWHHAREHAHFKLNEGAHARARRVCGQAVSVREHREGEGGAK